MALSSKHATVCVRRAKSRCVYLAAVVFLWLVVTPIAVRAIGPRPSPPHVILEYGDLGPVTENISLSVVLITEWNGDDVVLDEDDAQLIKGCKKRGLSDDEIEKSYAPGRIKLATVSVLRGTAKKGQVLVGPKHHRGRNYLYIGPLDKTDHIWRSRFIRCNGLPIEEIRSVVRKALEIQATIKRKQRDARRNALLADFLAGPQMHAKTWLTLFPHWFQELTVWKHDNAVAFWDRLQEVIEAELDEPKEVVAEYGYTPAGWALKFLLDARGPRPALSILLQCLDRKTTLTSLSAQLIRDLTKEERELAIEKMRTQMRNAKNRFDYNMDVFDALARLRARKALPELRIAQDRAAITYRRAAEVVVIQTKLSQPANCRNDCNSVIFNTAVIQIKRFEMGDGRQLLQYRIAQFNLVDA